MRAIGMIISVVYGCALVQAQPPAAPASGGQEVSEEVLRAIEKFNQARGAADAKAPVAAPAPEVKPEKPVKPAKPLTAAEKEKAKKEAAEQARLQAEREKQQKAAEEAKALAEKEKQKKAAEDAAKLEAEKKLLAEAGKASGGEGEKKAPAEGGAEAAVKIDGEVKDLGKVVTEAKTEPDESLKIKVEKLHMGSGEIDPKKVKLSAPFPAKPLNTAPAGWQLESPATTPPFQRTVELAPGASISLSIRPHVLIPTTDGASTFAISEPGFDASKGYEQKQTVGAVLSASVQKLDEDAKKLGDSIDLLQQLLSSLPMPAEKVEEAPEATPPVEGNKIPVNGGKNQIRGRK